jgi:hypothetical protein
MKINVENLIVECLMVLRNTTLRGEIEQRGIYKYTTYNDSGIDRLCNVF